MGGLLLIVGLAVLAFGLWNHLKGKRILAAPFQKTGEIAKNPVSPDPKGAMSTEGKVVPPEQTLLSPCTKQPCLAYEVKVERLYEKTETTQDGTKTVKGSETLTTLKGGAIFGLDDGSGMVKIDVSKGADFDNYKDGYKKELNGHSGSSHIQFGELSYDVPVIGSSSGWTTGFKATEKFVPVEGNLFVLGKLEGASLVKPGWRSMMTSAKGREGLLGSLQKKKKFSFIGGGIMAVLSIPAMIFAPEPDPNAVSAYCESALTDARQQCSDNVSDVDGEKFTWTVTKPGQYEIKVIAPAKKISFMPQFIVKDSKGEEVANESGDVGGKAIGTVDVKAGTYELTVLPADSYMVKGGFSFDMAIKALNVEQPKAVAEGGEAPAAGAKGAYSAEQLTERIEYLNELCPDTFCEGQFNYQFKKLECLDAKTCVLSFEAKDQDHPKAKPIAASIAVGGFTSLKQDDDKEFVYEGSFDDMVGQALAKWEQNPKATVVGSKVTAAPPAAPAKKAAPAAAPAPVKPAPAAKPMLAKPAAKPSSVAAAPKAAPVAAPAPVKSPPAAKSAPVAPAAKKSSSKNMDD